MKVSIAIPCLNAAQWLQQCIESALLQTGVEPEVIVVDNGSTDGSVAVAQSFGSRISFLSAPKQGANRARNLALQHARGEWVQFLDADDYLEPQKISTQLQEAHGGATADILYSPVWIDTVAADGGIVREMSETSPAEDLDTQWIRWHIPQTGGALWRRETLLQMGGWQPDQPCCQEHELYLRARQGGLAFTYTPTPGAVYRIWSEDTLCRKDPIEVAQVRTTLMDRMLTWLERTGKLKPQHRREIGRACFEMARTMARFDLDRAVAYHRERKERGLMRATGPAAPFKYRMVYRLLGFKRAEEMARKARERSAG